MKKLLPLGLIVLCLAAPSAAGASSGQLDTTFGLGGKAITLLGPVPEQGEEPEARITRSRGGRTVAEVGNILLAYLPDGDLDPNFGSGGKVSVAAPPGATLRITGVASDTAGRILVGGTVKSSELAASVFVARYLPQGLPDPSFGDGGVVITSLGLPAPAAAANQALNPIPAITEPVVEASGLAVDASDRPLLTGSWISGYRNCYPFITETRSDIGYVARLTADGSIDTSFGKDGVAVPNASKELQFSPSMSGGGVRSIGTLTNCLRGASPQPELTWLREDGAFRARFADDGRLVLPASFERPILASDHFGRLLLLGSRDELAQKPLLLRFRMNGVADARLGAGHGVELSRPTGGSYGALASDYFGRPILAGSTGSAENGWRLLLVRRQRTGGVDREFGRRGTVLTPLSGRIVPSRLTVGAGKILVGGAFFKHGEYGIALARYLNR